MSIKIVILGPESTGKSSLCAALADHYQSIWCPEYAREYLSENGTVYSFDDLLEIAKGQLALEDSLAPADGTGEFLPYFIDTNMYVMKIWCEFVFGKCHKFILEQIVHRHYDLYLLCANDLPWQHDPLREYPDDAVRARLFKMYQEEMHSQEVPFKIITGHDQERVRKAIDYVEEFRSTLHKHPA